MATTTNSVSTASEVLAYCGACKMDLAAIIIAKVASKIAKVQCKTCKKEHAFKAPKGVSEPGTLTPVRRVSKASSDLLGPKSVSVELEWQKLMDESAQANRVKYTPKANLALGDVVLHPSFGDGIVTRLSYPNKAEVMFKTDIKILVHSR